MKKILVLSGGGAHTIAYLGIWQFIHEKIYADGRVDERYIPDYIIGTSGGALLGCLMCARKNGKLLSGEDIKRELIKHRPWELARPKPIKWGLNALYSWGAINIKRIRQVIKDVLDKYNISWSSFTKPMYQCVVADLTEGRRKYIPVDMAMDLDVAITASIAVPGVFTPVWYEKHCYVDGGVCEGFPIKCALKMGRENVKILGISPFGESRCHDIDKFMDYFLALFHTLLQCKQKDMNYLLNEEYGDIHLVSGSYAKNMFDFSLETINKNYERGLQMARENEEKIDEFFTG